MSSSFYANLKIGEKEYKIFQGENLSGKDQYEELLYNLNTLKDRTDDYLQQILTKNPNLLEVKKAKVSDDEAEDNVEDNI
jgi:hypothetical protein